MASYLTQQDINDYGYDVLDLAQRAAMHAMTPELQRIDYQNAELRQQIAEDRRRGLYQTLDAQMPDWRQIDDSPQWRQWLLFSDPLNGRPRQALLNDAIAKNNAARVLSFFRGYLAETPAAGRTSQWTPPAAAGRDKPVYRRADITAAHHAYMKGAYKGREAEYEALQADFVAAGREGRISDLPVAKGKAPHG